jgi:hypothetical protein
MEQSGLQYGPSSGARSAKFEPTSAHWVKRTMEVEISNMLTYIIPIAIASLFTLYRNSIFCLWSCNPKVVNVVSIVKEGFHQLQEVGTAILIPYFRFVGLVLRKAEDFQVRIKEIYEAGLEPIALTLRALIVQLKDMYHTGLQLFEPLRALMVVVSEFPVMVKEFFNTGLQLLQENLQALMVFLSELPVAVYTFVLKSLTTVAHMVATYRVKTQEVIQQTLQDVVESTHRRYEQVFTWLVHNKDEILDTFSLMLFLLCTAIIVYNFFKSMTRNKKKVDDFRDIGRPFTRSMKRKLASNDGF